MSRAQLTGLDWIEQGLTSPPTQYRLSGRQLTGVLSLPEGATVQAFELIFSG